MARSRTSPAAVRFEHGLRMSAIPLKNESVLVSYPKAGFKSLFQKSPLKSRAVHGATICDVILPINT